VLIVSGGRSDVARPLLEQALYDPQTGSLAPLLTIDRQAFWPGLFTSQTLQVVHVIPPYRAISVEQAEEPSYRALTEPTARDLSLNPYLAHWYSAFDYVLVLQPGYLPSRQALVPEVLRPLAVNAVCSLYAIRK
jgi:hypothetical protein